MTFPAPIPFNGVVPDFGGDPISRAALQEEVRNQNAEIAQSGMMVPQSQGYFIPNGWQQTGAGVTAKPGWTAQKDTGPALPPLVPAGYIPDWTGDGNPLSAGNYDMNPVLGGVFGYDRNAVAPRGESFLEVPGAEADMPNPNTVPNVVGGTISDLEY